MLWLADRYDSTDRWDTMIWIQLYRADMSIVLIQLSTVWINCMNSIDLSNSVMSWSWQYEMYWTMPDLFDRCRMDSSSSCSTSDRSYDVLCCIDSWTEMDNRWASGWYSASDRSYDCTSRSQWDDLDMVWTDRYWYRWTGLYYGWSYELVGTVEIQDLIESLISDGEIVS